MKVALSLALVLGVAPALGAQVVVDELPLIREATNHEQAGDFEGAQRILQGVLEKNPNSLTALLTLERVLRIEGRLADLIPYVQAHLKSDGTSAIGNQMLVRAFSSLDKVEDIDKAAAAWIKNAPRVETPYREIARVWQLRGDYTRALQYLEMGKARVNQRDALALELGDAYAALEQYPQAVREWDRAIGPDAHGLLLVQRKVAALRDGGARVLPPLVDALLKSPTLARRRAAAQLAIDAGLAERAEQIVRSIARELKGPERKNFLVEMARRSDASQLPRVAYFAYNELVPGSTDPEQTLAIRARLAELALAIGDTAGAALSYQALEQSLAPGSPQRRQAVALRIQLAVKETQLADAQRELSAFRREYPNAPETDAVAATLASAYLDRDDPDKAEDVLAGVAGARSNIARSRIALRRGDVAAAKNALLTAAPSLQGAEATATIRLVTLLGKVSRTGGELLGKSLARAGAGVPKEAVSLLEKGASDLPAEERPSVFDFAAALADRSQLPLDAERLRRRIVLEYPRSTEAPSALLALARTLMERSEAPEEAREYLEKLILEYPRSALVPQARQELDRLQGRVPRS